MKVGSVEAALSRNSKLIDTAKNIKNQKKNEMIREIELRKKSKELEAVFLTQMFKAMEKTVPKNTIFGGSKNSLATMMFSSVMGETLANQGGIGLADIIYNSLKEKESIPSIDEIKSSDITDNTLNFRLLSESNDE